MNKQLKRNILEKEVHRFFECGWLLKIMNGKYYLCNPNTSNLAYSKDDLKGDMFDTQFGYSNRDERDGAYRVLEFIEKHPEVISKYRKMYPGKIMFPDSLYENLMPQLSSGIVDVSSGVLDVTAKVLGTPSKMFDFTADRMLDAASVISNSASVFLEDLFTSNSKGYPWENAYKLWN